MNAHAEIPAQSESDRAAIRAANEWRGRCINWFARMENVVMTALAHEAKGVKAESLFSQKLTRLERALAGNPRAMKAIAGLRDLVEVRNTIVHCEATVFEAKGKWLLQFADFEGRVCRRISDDEGEAICRDLQARVDRLRSYLAITKQTPDPADTPSA